MASQKPECALLYGVTGSGKTQVYIRLIHTALAAEKTALVLVPEIALTPQLLALFSAQFGDEIALLHSMLARRGTLRRMEAGALRPGQSRGGHPFRHFRAVASPGSHHSGRGAGEQLQI